MLSKRNLNNQLVRTPHPRKPKKNVDDKVRWTIKEKRALLESIQRHGLAELEKLAKDVKTKSLAEVELFLNYRRYKLTADYNSKQQNPCDSLQQNQTIIKWCGKIKEAVEARHRGKDYSVALEEILETAAKEESNQVMCEDEPNFRLLYLYLARAMSGSIPPSLPPTESWVLLHAWRSLTKTLTMSSWQQEKEFLQKLHLRQKVPVAPEFRKRKREDMWNHPEGEEEDEEIKSQLSLCVPNGNSIESSVDLNQAGQRHPPAGGDANAYHVWDLNEHYYAYLLASLNPLTVPVTMLERETAEVFKS